jgi:hypothetical protein
LVALCECKVRALCDQRGVGDAASAKQTLAGHFVEVKIVCVIQHPTEVKLTEANLIEHGGKGEIAHWAGGEGGVERGKEVREADLPHGHYS